MIARAVRVAPANAFAIAFSALVLLAITLASARATEIQRVVSPGGIEAWLVEDYTNPLIAVDFAFAGGASQDPQGKEGLARMVSSLLDEGAGDLDSEAYQLRLKDSAVQLSFSALTDSFSGSLETLATRKDEAFDLLHLAITSPRFDADPVERIRGQIKVGLKRDETDGDRVVSLALFGDIFADHPYGRPTRGTADSVDRITSDDLKAYHSHVLAKDTLKIGVVGAIDAATLGPALDRIFGDLPDKADLKAVPETQAKTSGVFELSKLDIPQSSILFALPALKRDDPDFMTAYVVNHIFGGGSFSSRLYEEVREKRGLVYSVYSYLYPFDHAGVLIAGAGTQNARVGETLDVVRAEVARMGAEGPSADELAKAKRYLVGAYPLRFDTSDKIASQLVQIQMENLGIDYINKRNSMIEAVTLDDARRVAREIFNPDKLAVAIAGEPQGVIKAPTGG
ncbi:MAG: insulinase family protein [Rhodobiaceae bacterium]|nr:insulinase family protein [Rhodobiaceae bacterium]